MYRSDNDRSIKAEEHVGYTFMYKANSTLPNLMCAIEGRRRT